MMPQSRLLTFREPNSVNNFLEQSLALQMKNHAFQE